MSRLLMGRPGKNEYMVEQMLRIKMLRIKMAVGERDKVFRAWVAFKSPLSPDLKT